MMHAPIEIRVTRDAKLEMDYEGASSWGYSSNCTPSAMQGAWVQLTQTLIPNDKVNDGAYLGLNTNFPPGRGRTTPTRRPRPGSHGRS